MKQVVELRLKKRKKCSANTFCQISPYLPESVCPRELWEQSEFEMSMDIDLEGR